MRRANQGLRGRQDDFKALIDNILVAKILPHPYGFIKFIGGLLGCANDSNDLPPWVVDDAHILGFVC